MTTDTLPELDDDKGWSIFQSNQSVHYFPGRPFIVVEGFGSEAIAYALPVMGEPASERFARWRERDYNRDALLPLRFAQIMPPRAPIDDCERVAAYLPGNYCVTDTDERCITIAGFDRMGWTLEEYVIPRLASGGLWAEEVDARTALRR